MAGLSAEQRREVHTTWEGCVVFFEEDGLQWLYGSLFRSVPFRGTEDDVSRFLVFLERFGFSFMHDPFLDFLHLRDGRRYAYPVREEGTVGVVPFYAPRSSFEALCRRVMAVCGYCFFYKKKTPNFQ
jgi:hypothetical protein